MSSNCPECGTPVTAVPDSADEVRLLLDQFSPGIQYFWSYEPEQPIYVTGLGLVHFVSATGGEGQGEHCSVVLRIGDRYFVADGFYDSYDSNDWPEDNFYEAVPAEETVTVYKKV